MPLGFIFAAVFLVFASPGVFSAAIGIPAALSGLLIRAWSSGHIRKNAELAMSGPYAYTRNPLYLGSFVMGTGFTVASGVWWLSVVFVVLFAGIYLPVMRIEARELEDIFGERFKHYASRVPLFIPYRRRYPREQRRFELSLYMRYREYQAALGFAAVCGTLFLKYWLRGWLL